ncbi:BTAD domain-containing putative transcriptional regulator [Lentzea tibetensis]|uniref:BTAD domain-containing putative transcriptional regulator n=1 Tax=Lentzea tibetensis TaxID=2591470 RepID=UPI001F2708E1|nr:BTAD domain-containing putative transcriptional regulator [Lentzea tibetensis]
MLAGTLRFVGRVLRGLIAAAVLLALVAGLPWALWHYIGWPLPDHIPAWAEVEALLLGPMTATFLLDFLACLCWPVWAAFVLDVIGCAAQATRDGMRAAHRPQASARGPGHALAAVLISAILLPILGNRATSPPTTPLSAPAWTGPTVVATAPAWHATPDASAVAVRRAALVTQQDSSAGPAAGQRPQSVVVRARDPESGVHDSLSRIAQRTLGDSARWPEIFELNKGKPQPNGKPFTNPHLIFPGEELRLPADAKAAPVPPPAQPPQPPPRQPSPEPSTQASATTPPSTTTRPPATSVPAAHPTAGNPAPRSVSDEPAIGWGPELFVGLGLAAAVSAALLVARRRHRNRYRPGSGRRDDLDLPVAPVVYQLRLAHLRAERDDELDLEDTDSRQDDRHLVPRPTVVIGVDAPTSRQIAPGLGVRDGREIALDLAAARGLGLIGAGAPAAARALLVTALTTATHCAGHLAMSAGTSVLVPADDLPLLLGHGTTRAHLPRSLRVLAGLDEALDELEARILRRAREQDSGPWPAVVLVARPQQHNHQRLQAVLDNGAPFGIVGILLGQWRAGVTAYVHEDGTISATGPGLGEALRGTQVFRVGADDATDLLDLLRHAQPQTPTPDAVLGSHVPGPRATHTESAEQDMAADDAGAHRVGGEVAVAGEDVLAADTELEVTAVAGPVDYSGTGLEIIETRAVPPTGARPRPAAVTERPPSSTSSEVHDHEAAVSDEPHSMDTGEPCDPASADKGDRAAVPVRLAVLGRPRVYWRPHPGAEQDVTGAFQPRLRELLMFLGLHPDGATRESLIGALWADSPPEKTTSALNTALSRLRGTLSKATDGALADIVVAGQGSFRLDPTVVDVDYWQFDRAVARRRAATTPHDRTDAYRDIVNSYTGPLADGMSTDWIESAREAIRRDTLDAVAALARALVDDDLEQTLDLLELARAFDPHNELLYRDIMRLQERLGRPDAIPRTLTLLTTRLAEVDDRPTPEAIDLAARLGQRHETASTATAGLPRGGGLEPRR